LKILGQNETYYIYISAPLPPVKKKRSRATGFKSKNLVSGDNRDGFSKVRFE